MMGHPSSPSPWWGKSLTEGASQILGTNDSTLLQLKPPHPSHVEGPVSPRCLSLVTYPNPSPSSLTIPRNKRIKATPTRSGRGLPRPASFGSGNPTRDCFAIKKPVRHSFQGPGRLYLTLNSCKSRCRSLLLFGSLFQLRSHLESQPTGLVLPLLACYVHEELT